MKIILAPTISFSLIGGKDNQEDCLSAIDNSGRQTLFVLCDGMGGHERGEVASRTVVDAITEFFACRPARVYTEEMVKAAVEYAYDELAGIDKEPDNDHIKKPSTTLTLVLLDEEGVIAAHIGDSRIYHLRRGEGVKYRSRDHSLVQQLIQLGEITEEEAKNHPRRNIVTRWLQPNPERRFEPVVQRITDIAAGDAFVLCSDGVLEYMDDATLADIATDPSLTDEQRTQRLIDAAQSGGTPKDNFSLIALRVKKVKQKSDKGIFRCWHTWAIIALAALAALAGVFVWQLRHAPKPTSCMPALPPDTVVVPVDSAETHRLNDSLDAVLKHEADSLNAIARKDSVQKAHAGKVGHPATKY